MSYSVSPTSFKIAGIILIIAGLLLILGSMVSGASIFSLYAFAGLIALVAGVFVLGIKKGKE